MSVELNQGQRYGPSRIGLTASTVLFDFITSILANGEFKPVSRRRQGRLRGCSAWYSHKQMRVLKNQNLSKAHSCFLLKRGERSKQGRLESRPEVQSTDHHVKAWLRGLYCLLLFLLSLQNERSSLHLDEDKACSKVVLHYITNKHMRVKNQNLSTSHWHASCSWI